MLRIRRAAERGHARHGWLESAHTFSFADYWDPEHVGFGPLRVINEDRVQPGRGFGAHSHRDMEILSYVLAGALEHKDSLGHGSVMRPGDVQLMRAGSGITHSEYNHSASELVHFLQIWITPERNGLAPGYAQLHFAAERRRGRLLRVVSPDGADGSLQIARDAHVYAALLEPGERVQHELAPGRGAWLQLARGAVLLSGERLQAGDGASSSDAGPLELRAEEPSELLLFDLA